MTTSTACGRVSARTAGTQRAWASSAARQPTIEGDNVSTTQGTITRVRGRVRVEHGAKRIRAYLGGELVADTIRPLLVWEKPYYPTYYFPLEDVRTELLSADGTALRSPSRGEGRMFTIRAGVSEAIGAALRYEESPFEELRNAIRFDWAALDAWFEEDEQVFTHPRDPYTRVDILTSSRHGTPRHSRGSHRVPTARARGRARERCPRCG